MCAPLVSIVIAFRSPPIGLFRLLDALREQDLPEELFEVVLVDAVPSSARLPITRAVADAAWPFAVRLLSERCAGLSRARNRGIRAVRGRYVVVTDAGISPEPRWLTTLVASAEGEQTFIVGGHGDSILRDRNAAGLDH